jgi:2-dehydro-3-deoxyphosphogluconate aldolase / (4S)-4-hydroxy-2-oxoglutarate aldolase
MTIVEILNKVKVIPIIVIEKLEYAIPLAKALSEGGLNVLEVTLRTPVALDAIKLMVKEFPHFKIGAGTIIDTIQFSQAKDAGACFGISPATTLNLVEAAQESDLPFLPGVSTVCEVMAARELGYHYLKFFPANLAGGTAMLKNFAELFPDVKFCPTGGINQSNVREYLQLPNVFCVGGSWLAAKDFMDVGQWNTITQLALDFKKAF